MKKENLELFESEWAILQKVWELEPCAAPTVLEAFQGEKGWAYTTVKTMIGRMVKKGLLKTEKMRNPYFTARRLPSPRLAKAKSPEHLKGPLTELLPP